MTNECQSVWEDCSCQDFLARLHAVFDQNDLSCYLTDSRDQKLLFLALRMVTENKKYNLTAITAPDAIILRHLADAVSLSPLIAEGATLLDVGTGGGFPSLPLAICRPDISITAIDSTAKKIRYVAETAELLSLSNLQAKVARAEDICRPPLREGFDCVTARAVSALPVLSELCLPFCRIGGKLLAMKGTDAEAEAQAALSAIKKLGGGAPRITPITLRDSHEELLHAVVAVDKLTHTPQEYPRVYTRIVKDPLA